MPNYYAHLTFGQRVLADLPAYLSELIEQEREAFDLGCLGPDPLFFYQPIRPNAVRREGSRCTAAPPCPRWSVCARLSRTAYPCPPATELASSAIWPWTAPATATWTTGPPTAPSPTWPLRGV
ncbi:hypothetical protein M5E87_08415 [Flavonifractor plautii]|nr:hypothetical protein M5E87_08415 [Flavonifractor plautii]